MNGTVAQIIALSCYGNALLANHQIPNFFPEHSTSRFCESVRFVTLSAQPDGKLQEISAAENPDLWLAELPKRAVASIRLILQPQNLPDFSDRLSSAFVGGGGTWMMELQLPDTQSEFWTARWDIGNQQASDSRIWRVTYGLVHKSKTKPASERPLKVVKEELQSTLQAIHDFSVREDCGGFTDCFANALNALKQGSNQLKFYTDLALSGQLSSDAAGMMNAVTHAWVFGGMGSWNDLGFAGNTHLEYQQLSDDLFNILNESIGIVTNSTQP